MEIVKSQRGDIEVLAIIGSLDTGTAPELQKALIPLIEVGKTVELDLTELTYISSAGLRVLLLGEKTAKAQDCMMRILNVGPAVKAIFEITGFADILKIQ